MKSRSHAHGSRTNLSSDVARLTVRKLTDIAAVILGYSQLCFGAMAGETSSE